jgi:hypothetical protein
VLQNPGFQIAWPGAAAYTRCLAGKLDGYSADGCIMRPDERVGRFPDFFEAWFPDDGQEMLVVKVRVYNTWDEIQFQRMLATGEDVLARISQSEIESSLWDGCFDGTIKALTDLMENPVTLPPHAFEPPENDPRPYVEQRIDLLEALRQKYLSLLTNL